MVHINKAVDIYNIVSIESKLCLGVHDIDKISGNVYLKILKNVNLHYKQAQMYVKLIND